VCVTVYACMRHMSVYMHMHMHVYVCNHKRIK